MEELAQDKSLKKQYKAVVKALGLLASDPAYKGLQSRPIQNRECPHGKTLFHSYAENNTPAAWRIIWCYAPKDKATTENPNPVSYIWIVSIEKHPNSY